MLKTCINLVHEFLEQSRRVPVRREDLGLYLVLIEEAQACGDHVAVSETGGHTRVFFVELLHLVKLVDYLLHHKLWSDWALVGKIEAKVDRCLSDLLLHISCLLQNLFHDLEQVISDDLWLDVPEECRERLLGQLQNSYVVFQHWVFETL